MQWRMLAAAGVCAGAAPAALAEDSDSDELIEALRTEVAELRSTVAQMQAERSDDWLTEQRAEEIKSLVQDVLADADTRASLLQDGVTAGWDKNFFLASADGNWKMRVKGQIQVRYVFNTATGPGIDQQTLYGFEIRRAKLKFDGNIFDPTWKYVLNIASDYDDRRFDSGVGGSAFSGNGEIALEDAIIIKDFENGFLVWLGQFKAPFMQSELISSTKQQFVERSLVNEEFNQDRFTGIMGVWSNDQFKVQASVGDGFGSWNFPASYVPIEAGDMEASVGVTGRVNWLALGGWNQFKQQTSPRGSKDGLKIGGAVHWEEDKYSTFVDGSTGKSRFWGWTADLMWQSNGWNLFAYGVGRHMSGFGGSTDQYGAVVQGGYYLTDDWEGFARYEWGDNDAPGVNDLSVVTVGANYYLNKHILKWTTDVGVSLGEVAPTWGSIGANWRASDSGQVVVRSQFQLLF